MQTKTPAITEFIYAPILNYALQQAHVPVVRRLVLKNPTATGWKNLRIHISLFPDFATPFEQHTEALPAGGSLELDAIKMPVRSAFLAELTERVEGSLHLKVTAEDAIIFEEHYEIAILPYDQWHGISLLPEGIAAFVTPNHPQISAIIRRASEILNGWTGSPSFDEYQTRNPDRVRKQMAAVYEAIAGLQLVYCTVPASFEEQGQRVRLADAALGQKMGNCLDLSLLYAACLEAVGIHPLLIIIHGHAFAGAWLIDESFADPVCDDPSLLSKRTAAGINEITLVESTAMAAGRATRFDDAVRTAESHLLNTEAFILFVDVKRARFSRIRPLPLRIASAGGFQIVEDAPEPTRSSEAPEELGNTVVVTDGTGNRGGKQQLWERKLLDLTLRNNLLNLRVTKGTIQFIHINPAALEDALAVGQEFQLLPRPADWDNPLRSAGLYQALHDADPMLELAAHELQQKRLRCYLGEAELAANLTQLYRSSRTAIEENGASTLYVALGFLKWYETAASEAPRYAPVLLLPVEMVRRAARQGYVIRSREEEPMMNITLLEKLRQDYGISIGGLDALPRDERGVDVPQIFSLLRRGIMAQSRWNVEEQIVLGAFSFNKFILWNDIHNNAASLLKNKTVASLVSGKLEWDVTPEAGHSLDETVEPSSVALPIATDSSQLEAVIASGEGQSFVLHGPPGTGKSQTITNIIANALFAGKRVLFVAAKKAALDVVESRLESIGIGPFCLELHSNKAKKTSIIEQLKRASAMSRKPSPEAFSREGVRLKDLRSALNEHVKALHHTWPFGLSLYEAFSRWSNEDSATTDAVAIPATGIASLTAAGLQAWNDAVGELAVVARAIGNYAGHPLKGIGASAYSLQLKNDAAISIQAFSDKLTTLEALLTVASQLLHIPNASHSPDSTKRLAIIATALLEAPHMPPSLLCMEAPEQTGARLKAWAQQGRRRDQLQATLLRKFSKGILGINAAQLQGEWNVAGSKWFLPKWIGQSKVRKALQPFATGAVAKASVPAVLQELMDLEDLEATVSGSTTEITAAGFLWQDKSCDWDALDKATDAVCAMNSAAIPLMNAEGVKSWRATLAATAGDGTGSFLASNGMSLRAFVQAEAEAANAKTLLYALLHIKEAAHAPFEALWTAVEKGNCTRWLSGLGGLKDWCAWVAAAQKSAGLGLEAVATAFEQGGHISSGLEATYRKSFYRAAAEYILSQSPQLASFNAALFEEKIARFKALSDNFEQLTRQELYARLSARIPDFSQEASQSSEVGILQKAIRSNARAMSIRRLFDAIPTLLPRLAPCALMSPISVAQYFDADAPKFDLVIFDEASQMPTCDAVGAMARGHTTIIVGDPKQMPPTSFFATNNVDEDNLEAEDLESILDDCLALSMPSRHLLWHYRSRHESLIAFSNAKYYDNSLLTFPSTDDLATKVSYVHVPGFYDKGKTRQNKAEAHAIVAEILRRLSHPELSKRSMGVVTFSVVQQNLIEDLLTAELGRFPLLEKTAMEAAEPLFIKNLENVQGDERDVILFSICYGPDETGRISLNFGPLNRDGGWRRLNVAVSRARYEMKVFSTLRADQIDLARSDSEGVAGLKGFLAFAEKGKSALPSAAPTAAMAGGLEDAIAAAIRAKGYEVHQAVGRSGYRVDMAVVHPARPHQYLLGILCDGPAYGAARTTRDREIVQPGVLRSLGWQLHRVWSADWWEQKENVLAGILAAIKAAEAAPEAIAQPEAGLPAPDAQPAELLPKQAGTAAPALNNAAAPAAHTAAGAQPYHTCRPAAVAKRFLDNLLLPQGREMLVTQVAAVLAAEAPVSKALLYRRVLAAWGIGRTGARITAHLDNVVTGMGIRHTVHGNQTIFWHSSQQPDGYNCYRVAAAEADKRDAEDLPPEEVAAAVKAILSHQLSLPKGDLVRECARVFGYARLGSKVEEAIEAGVNVAVARGIATWSNGRIIYNVN